MEKQRAQEILGAARESNATVSVYGVGRSSRFSIGWVVAFSDSHVLLELVSQNGRADGWLLRTLDDIARIDSGGRLEETVVALYRARDESHLKPLLPANDSGNDLGSDLKLELLLAARTHDLPVRIYNGNRDNIEGFVREVGTSTVTVDVFDEHGIADGESTISFDEFDAFKVNDEELQDLKMLARWHDSPPLA